MTEVFAVRLQGEEGKAPVHARAEWTEGDVKLTLVTNSGKAYKLELKSSELDALGQKWRIEDVSAWADEAFRTSSKTFAFAVSEKKKELTWKKVGEEGNKMRVRVGTFALEETDFAEANASLLDAAVDRGAETEGKLADLTTRHNRLMADLKESRKLFDQLVKDKGELEKDLFGRFLPILHTKQDKIAELERQVKRGVASTSNNSKSEEGDGDDSYGSDTDVDEEPAATPDKRPRLDESTTSQKSLDDSQNFLKM